MNISSTWLMKNLILLISTIILVAFKMIVYVLKKAIVYGVVSKVIKIVKFILEKSWTRTIKSIFYLIHLYYKITCKLAQFLKKIIVMIYNSCLLPICVYGGIEYKRIPTGYSKWQKSYRLFAISLYGIHIFSEKTITTLRKNICFKDIGAFFGFTEISHDNMEAGINELEAQDTNNQPEIIRPNKTDKTSAKNNTSATKNKVQSKKTVKINKPCVINHNIPTDNEISCKGLKRKNPKIDPYDTIVVETLDETILKKVQQSHDQGDITSLSTSEILGFHIADGIYDGISFLD
ncbi:hypothetical protein LUQ84_001252 [Hamiltosporidium tvaerminnensis]|nr:hypothetical protein LUQ84_001252 [Hamiltosporidium tvaerminnensis]